MLKDKLQQKLHEPANQKHKTVQSYYKHMHHLAFYFFREL